MDLMKELMGEKANNDNKSDTLNANIGTDGTNETYDKAQGNRGKLMNPTYLTNQRKARARHDGDEDIDEGDVFEHGE